MNIMLVAATKRTGEIGLRKAIGAPDGALLGQFLLEATVLSLGGGLLGICGGIVAAILVSRIAGWHTLVSPSSIGLAVGVSMIVGILFWGEPRQPRGTFAACRGAPA